MLRSQSRGILAAPVLQRRADGPGGTESIDVVTAITAIAGHAAASEEVQHLFAELLCRRDCVTLGVQLDLIALDLISAQRQLPGSILNVLPVLPGVFQPSFQFYQLFTFDPGFLFFQTTDQLRVFLLTLPVDAPQCFKLIPCQDFTGQIQSRQFQCGLCVEVFLLYRGPAGITVGPLLQQ